MRASKLGVACILHADFEMYSFLVEMTRSPNNLTWDEALTLARQRTATVWLLAYANSPPLMPDGDSGSASGLQQNFGPRPVRTGGHVGTSVSQEQTLGLPR